MYVYIYSLPFELVEYELRDIENHDLNRVQIIFIH